ncbi:DUF2948 family protein, partial [Hansschlegelia beijingensis]
MSDSADAPLKLAALDAEDLEVLAAHLQDFVLKVGDLVYLPGEQRLAMVGNRADRRAPGEVRQVDQVADLQHEILQMRREDFEVLR